MLLMTKKSGIKNLTGIFGYFLGQLAKSYPLSRGKINPVAKSNLEVNKIDSKPKKTPP